MWETVPDNTDHLSHDMPCHRCGHAMHTFLACSDECDCEPAFMPGSGTSLITAGAGSARTVRA